MVLNPRQFAGQLREKALSTYDKHAGKFLDFMDQHGADIKSSVDDQLANIEKLIK